MKILVLLFAMISHAQAQPLIGDAVLSEEPRVLGPSCMTNIVMRAPSAGYGAYSSEAQTVHEDFGQHWAPSDVYEAPGADPIATFVKETAAGDDTVQSVYFTERDFVQYRELIDKAEPVPSKLPEFQKNCGTKAINDRSIGGGIYVSIHIRMPEASESARFSCQWQIQRYLDFDRNWAKFATFTDAPMHDEVIKACPNATLSFNVVQAGGSRRDFPKSLKMGRSDGNKFFASTKCKISDISGCSKAAADLNNYVFKGTFDASFDDQKDVGSEGGYAVISTMFKRYDYISGYFPSPEESTPNED